MSIKDLSVLLSGKEASTDAFGTQATMTSKWVGVTEASITPIVESEIIKELKGSLQPGFNTVIKSKSGEAKVDGVLTYTGIIYALEGLFGTVVPGAVDTDACYDRTYAAPTIAAASPQRYSILYGDSDNYYVLTGATVSKLGIKGETGGTVEYSLEFVGKSVTNTGYLSDVADSDKPTNVAMGCHCSLWIDPGSDAVGTTPITTTAFSFDLSVDPKRSLKYHLGNCNPDSTFDTAWEGELKLVLEVTSAMKTILDTLISPSANVQKNVKISMQHPVSLETFYFTFGGVVLEAPEFFADEDGVVTVELTLKGIATEGTTYNWLGMYSNAKLQTLA
jgi:hypothetical protein